MDANQKARAAEVIAQFKLKARARDIVMGGKLTLPELRDTKRVLEDCLAGRQGRGGPKQHARWQANLAVINETIALVEAEEKNK